MDKNTTKAIKLINAIDEPFFDERPELFKYLQDGIPTVDWLDSIHRDKIDERLLFTHLKISANLPLTKDELHIAAAFQWYNRLSDEEIGGCYTPTELGEDHKELLANNKFPIPRMRSSTIKPLYTIAWEKYLNGEPLDFVEYILVTARIVSGSPHTDIDGECGTWNHKLFDVVNPAPEFKTNFIPDYTIKLRNGGYGDYYSITNTLSGYPKRMEVKYNINTSIDDNKKKLTYILNSNA